MLENLPAVRGAVSGSLDPITDMRTIARDPAGPRYRLLFERNVDGILLVATGGRVLDANIAACNLLQIPRDEISRGIVSVPEPEAPGDTDSVCTAKFPSKCEGTVFGMSFEITLTTPPSALLP